MLLFPLTCLHSKLLPTASDEALAKAELAKDVHHGLHRRVVSDGEGTEVEDAPQFQGLRVRSWQLGCILGEVYHRVTHHTILLLTCGL